MNKKAIVLAAIDSAYADGIITSRDAEILEKAANRLVKELAANLMAKENEEGRKP
jgi:hypothetical protein